LAALVPGAVVGGYRLVEVIGAGGMGTVWRASEPGGQVALKTMHPHLADDAELVRRFQREYAVGAKVRHPNLIRMRSQGQHDGVPYLVMDIASGKSVRRLIDLGGPFREWEAATIGQQVASALAALHGAGVVHRDLKASNIVLDRDLHAVVIDLGIARVDGEQTRADGGFMGSAEYAGPEPYLGRPAGTPADIYALGIVLFELLTGDVPFRASSYADVLRMHAEMPAPRVSTRMPLVSETMDYLVFAMLDKKAERRPNATQVQMACASVLTLLGRAPAVSAPGASFAPVPPAAPAAPIAPRPSSSRPSTHGGGARRDRAAVGAGTVLIGIMGAILVALAVAIAAGAGHG